jgi:hypothetical protein
VMEVEVEHMTETIALASNVKMLMKKHKRKRREIIATLILATVQTKMMVMMTTILVAMAVTREAITIAKMVEVMKRNQEMERKMKVQMFRSEN